MKTSRFRETQIITILKQGESGMKVTDLCREHGNSDATYYNWKAKYGGLEASDSSGPHVLDRNFQMISEIFCGIFLFNERSRRWHDDHDAIIPRRLKRRWR